MPVKIQQRPFLLGLGLRADPARLRHGLWVETGVGRAMEAVGRRAIIKEWRLRSPHDSDWKPWEPREKGMWTRNGMRSDQDDSRMDHGECGAREINTIVGPATRYRGHVEHDR